MELQKPAAVALGAPVSSEGLCAHHVCWKLGYQVLTGATRLGSTRVSAEGNVPSCLQAACVSAWVWGASG